MGLGVGWLPNPEAQNRVACTLGGCGVMWQGARLVW